MNQRALRQHAAAVRQRKHYQQTRQAHLDFLTAAVMLFHEVRNLSLGIQLSQPEYREFRRRLLEAEDCEEKYLALRRPRIVKVADLPPDPSPHIVAVEHLCDNQHCFMPAKHSYKGKFYCGIHCPLSEQEDPVAAAEGKAVREMELQPGVLYHGPERPQDWLPHCERCHKPFAGGYRSRTGTVNYCNNCLNTFDSEGA